jgi:hypothetical protein
LRAYPANVSVEAEGKNFRGLLQRALFDESGCDGAI